MKIALAQTRPVVGDVAVNLQDHLRLAEDAACSGCAMIAFPELSLTGYEPRLADALATTADDPRFADLQHLSNRSNIVIALGVPLRSVAGIQIGLLILQPQQKPLTYAKQLLHADECPWFVPGSEQAFVDLPGFRIAPAICYESMQETHVARAHNGGANVYLATVAKGADGLARATPHYAAIARQYGMPVLMVNCTGPCFDMLCAGGSEAWDHQGRSIARVNATDRTLLVCDLH